MEGRKPLVCEGGRKKTPQSANGVRKGGGGKFLSEVGFRERARCASEGANTNNTNKQKQEINKKKKKEPTSLFPLSSHFPPFSIFFFFFFLSFSILI